MVVSQVLADEGTVDQRLSTVGEIKGGVRFGGYNTITAAPRVFWVNRGDAPPGASGEGENMTLGFTLAYTFDSLDFPLFPIRAFRAVLENTFYVPLSFRVHNVGTLNISAAIPLTGKLSLTAGGTAESDLGPGSRGLSGEAPFTGFFGFDRIYLPHRAGTGPGGAHRAAASLGLRFLHLKSLSFLGGRLIFSLSASGVQTMESSWDEFSLRDLAWCAALGIGLDITGSFGLHLRTGAGSAPAPDRRPVPFVSLDIGAFR